MIRYASLRKLIETFIHNVECLDTSFDQILFSEFELYEDLSEKSPLFIEIVVHRNKFHSYKITNNSIVLLWIFYL